MENTSNVMMVNGANPSMLWFNMASYLGSLSKNMMKTYRQRQRSGKAITWSELDYENKELHHNLDIIITGNQAVSDSTAPKYESVHRNHNLHLSESQLYSIIKETVKRVL